jgi:hypothetical protein
MYSNSNAIYRAELAGHVFETEGWEKNLIGTLALPVVEVALPEGQYPKFQKQQGQLLKTDVKARAPYSGFARGTSSFVQDTYACLEYGYEQAVDDTIRLKNATFFDSEVIATRLARRKLLLAHELRASSVLFNATTFTSTNSGTAYTTANILTFDVGLDVDDAKDRLISKGETANTVVIPYQVATRLRASTKFQNRARGAGVSSDAILNLDASAMADVFGVDRVLIGRAAYDGAGEGIAFSSSLIWSNSYIWVGNVGSSLLDGGAAYTLNWSQYGTVLNVETYRDEPIKSDIVRAAHSTAEKVVNAAAGEIIATQYS